MSIQHPASSDTFDSRLYEFVAKFNEATRYGSDRAMHDLRVAMRGLAEKAGGRNFSHYYHRFQQELDHASGLTTKLGRSKRLREEHLQDTPA